MNAVLKISCFQPRPFIQWQHMDMVWCGTFFSGPMSTFVLDVLQITNGCTASTCSHSLPCCGPGLRDVIYFRTFLLPLFSFSAQLCEDVTAELMPLPLIMYVDDLEQDSRVEKCFYLRAHRVGNRNINVKVGQ
jgi:hypothetical protein